MRQVNINIRGGQTHADMFNYSANQYESAFRPQSLQNWCETNVKERSKVQRGQTTFIADDRGHLLPGVVKRGKASTDFKGTWDLPTRIPAHCINPTGRSVEGLNRLKSWGFDPQYSGSTNSHSLQDVCEQTIQDIQQDGADLSVKVPSQDAPPSSPHTDTHKNEKEDH